MLLIRPARPEDAHAIAACLLLAMEEIVYGFLGHRDPQEAGVFMRAMVESEGNQYSWSQCRVGEVDGGVVAAVNGYDGARLHQLRQPVLDHLRDRYGRDLHPEDETGPGEWYIDSFGVLPAHQGRGWGSRLLRHLIDELALGEGKTLGLLVEEDNGGAKRLYRRLGFRSAGTRSLLGKPLEHWQWVP